MHSFAVQQDCSEMVLIPREQIHVTENRPHLIREAKAPGSVAQSDARSTGDQEGVSSRLRSGSILSLRLIMKSFLRSFSPFR